MADLMNTARSGTLAAQSRMNVSANNIANIGTEGYHRQTATQSTHTSERMGNSFMGTGTYVSDISRAYNSFAERELTASVSSYGQAKVSAEKLLELDQIISSAGRAVPNGLNEVFSNFNNVADMPMDTAVRQNTLTSAKQMAESFNVLGQRFQNKVFEAGEQVEATVERINVITSQLADLNHQLSHSAGNDNGLLDQQNRLINDLAQYVNVSVIPQESGVKSILMGGSTMLVTGAEALELGTTHGDPVFYETRLTANVAGNSLILAGERFGGELQALMEYRDSQMPVAEAQLGLMALGVADAFNQQQKAGFDLNGQVGQAMFTEINSSDQMAARVDGYADNQGTKALAVQIDNVSALTTDSYSLMFDGTDYHLNGSATPLQADINDPGRLLTADGFSIRIDGNGTAQAGDRWQLTPTKNGALALEMTLTEPDQIAAAGYGLELVNGDGSAQLLSVDRSNANFPAKGDVVSVQVDMLNNSFVYTDAAGNPTAGAIVNDVVQINGIELEIDRTTVSGSTFSLDLAFGPADNANAVTMSALVNDKSMYGGSATLHDVYETMMTSGGSMASTAKLAAESASIVHQQASDRVQSEAEVNLDEEAADLMRFQQAYQASARVMTVAKETFDTLFNSVR